MRVGLIGVSYWWDAGPFCDRAPDVDRHSRTPTTSSSSECEDLLEKLTSSTGNPSSSSASSVAVSPVQTSSYPQTREISTPPPRRPRSKSQPQHAASFRGGAIVGLALEMREG